MALTGECRVFYRSGMARDVIPFIVVVARAAEKCELLQKMIHQAEIYPDRVQVEMHDGGAVLRLLSSGRTQKDETPGVNQGFVLASKWLPLLDSNQRPSD
jgi:hypothetical protein